MTEKVEEKIRLNNSESKNFRDYEKQRDNKAAEQLAALYKELQEVMPAGMAIPVPVCSNNYCLTFKMTNKGVSGFTIKGRTDAESHVKDSLEQRNDVYSRGKFLESLKKAEKKIGKKLTGKYLTK